jgi:hypothetical protein
MVTRLPTFSSIESLYFETSIFVDMVEN